MVSTPKWLWKVVGKKKLYIAVLTILQAASSGIGVLLALFLKNVVDSAVSKDQGTFRRDIILFMLLIAAEIVIYALTRWITEVAKSGIENVLKLRLTDNILHKDYASVSATHTEEWLNRLTSDTTVVASGTVDILPGFVGTVVRLVSALVVITLMDRWFAAVFLPGGAALILLTVVLKKGLKRLHKKIQESDGRLRIFLQERISNLMVVKSYAGERQTSIEAEEKMRDHRAARLLRNRLSIFAGTGFSIAVEGMYLAGLIYCANGIMTGRVSYGTLAAVIQLIGQIQSPLTSISGFLPRWYSVSASAERLMEVETFDDEAGSMTVEEAVEFYKNSFTSVGLRNASFTYPCSVEGETSPVIRNMSLEIRKGDHVAFTGHSGCGKSTVLKLLLSMYPLDVGERYIGAEPLTAYHRRMFAYVPQGNALMNGTVREVVSFACPQGKNDNERLRKSLEIACADEFVNDLDYVLGESGSGLSEGQMQRIAIARAIFSGSPVLLLDEATGSLDEDTEKRLLENLRKLTDKTVVIITHRKAALSICNRVINFSERGVTE